MAVLILCYDHPREYFQFLYIIFLILTNVGPKLANVMLMPCAIILKGHTFVYANLGILEMDKIV